MTVKTELRMKGGAQNKGTSQIRVGREAPGETFSDADDFQNFVENYLDH